MLNLLIAILIALGCNIQPTTTASEAELQSKYSNEYVKAKEIANTGNYRLNDGGGVVIVEIGGD
ncbi:MAG TPA: hypothetical protein PKD91_03185 [Bacteroidia bacterium]|nr:hypothetical protein [Bacteroidia bacterium]